MALILAFEVFGVAKPQGSTTTWNRPDPRTGQMKPAITHANRESLLRWRSDIRVAIQQAAPQLRGQLLKGPIAVRAVFYLAKPPSVPKKRAYPIVAPDLDKLCRAVGDAFEKVLVVNDAQIVRWDVQKVYTNGPSKMAVEVWEPDVVTLPVGESVSGPLLWDEQMHRL